MAEAAGAAPAIPGLCRVDDLANRSGYLTIRVASMAETAGFEPASPIFQALRFQRSGLADAQCLPILMEEGGRVELPKPIAELNCFQDSRT